MYPEPKLYEVHFRRHNGSKDDYSKIGSTCYSLDEAAKQRCVSGDLVVNAITKEVIKDESWLFDWEKKDTNCYAQQAIKQSQE